VYLSLHLNLSLSLSLKSCTCTFTCNLHLHFHLQLALALSLATCTFTFTCNLHLHSHLILSLIPHSEDLIPPSFFSSSRHSICALGACSFRRTSKILGISNDSMFKTIISFSSIQLFSRKSVSANGSNS